MLPNHNGPLLTFVAVIVAAFALAAVALTAARGQDVMPQLHQHGVTVPDWYDTDCCSNRDCHPVPSSDVDEVEPGVWMYLPTGVRFYERTGMVRQSKDGQFHVCISPDSGTPHCIYIVQAGV